MNGDTMSIPNGQARYNWRRVSKNHPCPVCKEADWCTVTSDGTLAKCMRVEAGAWKAKADKAGNPTTFTASTAPPDRTRRRRRLHARDHPRGPRRPVAPRLLRLARRLAAVDSAPGALRGRGLSDEEIDRRGYRTLPVHGRARLARDLRERLGDKLLTVPGFVAQAGREDGKPYLTIAGAAGLLVPVRDQAGRIVAICRAATATPGAGNTPTCRVQTWRPRPGRAADVPLGIVAPAETVRLTEGALKADVAAALSGLPTIGAAGLAGCRPSTCSGLGCKTVRLAFDADALDNAHVARALVGLLEAAAAAGLAVEMERWDKADGKGIDDLLAAGKTPDVLTGEPALAAIREALAASTAGEPPRPPSELDRLADVLAEGAPRPFPRRRTAAGTGPSRRGGPRGVCLPPRRTAAPASSCATWTAALAAAAPRGAGRTTAARRGRRLQRLRRPDRPRRADEGRPRRGPLTTWSGRIVELTEYDDDGAERRLTFAVEGALADGTPLPRVDVPRPINSHGCAGPWTWDGGPLSPVAARPPIMPALPFNCSPATCRGGPSLAIPAGGRSAAAGTICTPAARSGRMARPLASRLPCPTRWPGSCCPPPDGGGPGRRRPRQPGAARRLGPRPHRLPAAGGRLPGGAGRCPRPHRLRAAPGRPERRRQERVGGPGPTALRRRPGLRGTCPAAGFDGELAGRAGVRREGRAAHG